MIKNPDFSLGQRWISDTEADLGLGVITECQGRQVSIVFPASDEKRIYAKDSAPLTRVTYKPGDKITHHEGWSMVVESTTEAKGYLTYKGRRTESDEVCSLGEVDLTSVANFNHPKDRLFSAQIDGDNWFQLRAATLEHLRIQQSLSIRGLMASRTNLIPHQLYIANEVASRYAPRVLLADEVGLGKTIEAGLIISKQIISGLAARVLIIVPDSLVHQWLVEMLRRFNLHFSLFDEERCEAETAMADEGETINPFDTAQLVLCSLSLLANSESITQHAAAAKWDICVVDEAHHLEWHEDAVSPEYRAVETIAAQTKGLLLLTATPEQLGVDGHFARLRLLDRERFPSLQKLLAEEKEYVVINQLVQSLLNPTLISSYDRNSDCFSAIKSLLNAEQAEALYALVGVPAAFQEKVTEIVRQLIDHHGTSRILYRNTRSAIEGFPDRLVTGIALDLPELYHSLQQTVDSTDFSVLTPEQKFRADDWCSSDPRALWLAEFLRTNKQQKVLVICHYADTALALEEFLQLRMGFKTAVFHENLSLINRDRAAAYFADLEEGAQVLVCSEIGSEGRNFQFASQMVMFDLPLDPDLLEQRIGRLDRIGQQNTIEIYVPYFRASGQEILYRWYHEGLNAFNEICTSGPTLFAEFKSSLYETLTSAHYDGLEMLIQHCQRRSAEIKKVLEEGRDQLLEMHSFDKGAALKLIDEIIKNEQSHALKKYMERVFLLYGLNYDVHSAHTFYVYPGEHTSIEHFPELPEEGATITYSRETALSREDLPYITWEHPMVTGSIDMILSGDKGNTALITINHSPFQPGSLLVETLFTLSCIAPPHLQIGRYLPITVIRVLMDSNGKDVSTVMELETINQAARKVQKHLRQEVVKHQKDIINKLLDMSCEIATQQISAIQNAALTKMLQEQTGEIKRLVALKEINPNIRNEEIDFLKNQTMSIHEHIKNAQLKMEAIRIIVPT